LVTLHNTFLALLIPVFLSISAPNFRGPAAKRGIDPLVLEGICRYESAGGRILSHQNKNGTWDVGYCMNHRRKTLKRPRIPSKQRSVNEAAYELSKWQAAHKKYCLKLLQEKGHCGPMKWCQRPHPWWEHYNHGYRVLKNGYAKRVQCFINKGFKRCKRKEWRKISFK
jgi:hypothetical protein